MITLIGFIILVYVIARLVQIPIEASNYGDKLTLLTVISVIAVLLELLLLRDLFVAIPLR